MENATKRIGMASGSTHWEKAGMTQEEWKKAVKFDSTDWGWVIMSIGMAIGSGIVFLPVQVGCHQWLSGKKLGILLGDYLLHHDYYGSHDVLYGYHE